VVPSGGQYSDGGPPSSRRRNAQGGSSGASLANERRLVPDEVLVALVNAVTPAQITALQRRHRLTPVERQTFQLAGTTLMRWRIPDRRSVATVVRALERDRAVASVQPNYLFTMQENAKPTTTSGLPQYGLAKLRLPQAHELVKGDDVRVAVIDSGIDAASSELAGNVAETFDTLATPMKPHKHGTAIAGLIAAHGKLMGAAPDARILAVRAFDPDGEGAKGTTFNILKGLDWAAAHGARVINMSFAGPSDPELHRSLAAAHKKGIVLVAAAGNAGPKSPPLYPAADPDVIAVTATDADDKLFEQSNRGDYVAIAAPGADILVVNAEGGYEALSGTSFSAAEVSGIVALMLQREPALSPDKARDILMATAKDLGPKGRDPLFGAGLADAYGAVMAETPAEKPPVVSATPPVERVSTGQR
jgi:subtilisin family serine protease